MKLFHLFFAMILVLLGVTSWLAFDSHRDAVAKTNELELYKRRDTVSLQPPGQVGRSALDAERALIAAQSSPGAGHVPPSASYPNMPSIPGALPPSTAPSYGGASALPAANMPPPMTQWEKKVLSLPAIAKVKDYQKEYGFVILDAGADRHIENKQRFAIRRYNAIVGKISVHDVDQFSAVGDLISKSVPQGVLIEVGDDVVQDLPQDQ